MVLKIKVLSANTKRHRTIPFCKKAHDLNYKDSRKSVGEVLIFKSNYVPYWILGIKDSKEFNSSIFGYSYDKQ